MSDETLDTKSRAQKSRKDDRAAALVVLWSAHDPKLAGACLLLPAGKEVVLGRAGDDGAESISLVRQRPGDNEPAPKLEDPFLSRAQLRVKASIEDETIEIENLGKRDLLDEDGRTVRSLTLSPGDIADVRGRLLLLAMRRPTTFAPLQNLAAPAHRFGDADTNGIVGESEAAWRLRDGIAFVAERLGHVLLLGESGTGKESVARAIHDGSAHAGKRFVSRNAATLPAGLIDAELFGHVANYPNVGMPERPGLIGEANGSTLFLDEIGELPHELSTKLLRVLDEGGEYQRLGDTKARSSKFRLVGATNRAASALKADVAARFRLRIAVPPLGDRREDIPLLARHLLQRAATQDTAIGARFFEGWNGKTGEPRLDGALLKALVSHAYTTHARELDLLLWTSLQSSTGGVAELTPAVEQALDEAKGTTAPEDPAPRVDVRRLTAEDVRGALERAGGVYEKACRELGLSNRHALKRLVKKFGLREA